MPEWVEMLYLDCSSAGFLQALADAGGSSMLSQALSRHAYYIADRGSGSQHDTKSEHGALLSLADILCAVVC